MTDQKKIAAIFNDFMALYRGTSQIGIQEICKKYENHRMLIGLLANLDAATSIPVPKVMKECYEIYKKYRDRELEGKDWEAVVEETRILSEKWNANAWYYTLEVEPGGVIRQKRTEYDRQNKDIEAASAFLREWQLEIQKRITENDRELANRSRQLRMESYAEMRKKKVKINGGLFQGKYLADVLEADLMEMPDTLQQAA